MEGNKDIHALIMFSSLAYVVAGPVWAASVAGLFSLFFIKAL